MNRILRLHKTQPSYSVCRLVLSRCKADKVMPKNVLEPKTAAHTQPNGPIVDRKPFKMPLQADKKYAWCVCGHSKTQPLCDGGHKTTDHHIKWKPIWFQVDKDGDYWICMCRQTKNRPFCDGAHKQLHNQGETLKN